VLDFKNVNYVSSAGLRVLLSLHKKMSAKDGMKLTDVNDAINDVFEVTGFDEILTYDKGE
jgi:anti-sigma B factor antagonist